MGYDGKPVVSFWAESGAAPATVSGEWRLHFVSLGSRKEPGKAGAIALTREPGDLPFGAITFLGRGFLRWIALDATVRGLTPFGPVHALRAFA